MLWDTVTINRELTRPQIRCDSVFACPIATSSKLSGKETSTSPTASIPCPAVPMPELPCTSTLQPCSIYTGSRCSVLPVFNYLQYLYVACFALFLVWVAQSGEMVGQACSRLDEFEASLAWVSPYLASCAYLLTRWLSL